MSDTITIENIYTRKDWFRKVGEGPWEKVDLSMYGGQVPVIFLDADVEYVKMTELRDRQPPSSTNTSEEK